MQWGTQRLEACHTVNNSSVELKENSWISADPIGRVSQYCSQALDSRRPEGGRLHKERTSEPAHAGRVNWMPRNILNPSMSRCFKKSLQILWLEKGIRMSSWRTQRAALTCACKWDHEDRQPGQGRNGNSSIPPGPGSLLLGPELDGKNGTSVNMGSLLFLDAPCVYLASRLCMEVNRGGPQTQKGEGWVFIISRTFQHLVLPTCLDLTKAGILWKHHQLGLWYLLIYSDIMWSLSDSLS